MSLQAASEELIASEHNKKKMKEEYEQIIKGYQDKMGQMGLHIRTRDLQIMVVEDKVLYCTVLFAVDTTGTGQLLFSIFDEVFTTL